MISCVVCDCSIFIVYLLSLVLSLALALGISRRAVMPTSKSGIRVLLNLASRCGPIVIVRVMEGLILKDLGSPMVTCAFKVLADLKLIMSTYACSSCPSVAITGKVLW
jgi:hypothetical protein